jgi:diguanylate cyclase (GGDEF)-like protein
MGWLVRPAATLLGRLRYAHKFVVVGLVLLVPLGFVTNAYVGLQDSQIAFSVRERLGVAYMTPLVELTAKAVAARHEVSTGADTGLVELDAAIDRVEEADRRHGAALGVSGEWAAVRDLLQTADAETAAHTAFHAYNRAVDALRLLIVHVGDRSNLTLDPDLDTYYLIDALQFRLPILLDMTGRAADRAVLAVRYGAEASTDVLIEVALANGVLSSTRAALHTGIGTSVASTRSSEVRRLAPARLAAVDTAVAQQEAQLTTAIKHQTLAGVRHDVADRAREATHGFARMSAVQLDRLLAVRIAGFSRRARTVQLVAVLAALLAVWLFAGFYLSVTGPVRRIVAMLQAVAAGDLDHRVVVNNRDELRFIANALNDTVATTKAASDRLAYQATHDVLTGLPNRALILDRLEHGLRRLQRGSGRMAVLFIDLDRFKPINDFLGHEAGDEVLRTVAERLRAAVRPADTIGRLAGDEFIVLCEGLPAEHDAIDIAARVVATLSEPIVLRSRAAAGRKVSVGASVGIAFASTARAGSPDQLLGDADVAMYRAKQRGRGRVEVFDEQFRETSSAGS